MEDALDLEDGRAPGKAVKSTRKKPYKRPACDSCKFRRVLCHPQNPPDSCPRCVEKGIQCTTTPVVRKKPTGRTGKRIEEAKATFGTTNIPSPVVPVASSSKGSGSKDSTPPEVPLHYSPSQQQQQQQQQQHQQQNQQQQIPINTTVYRSEALEHPLTISIMDRENLLGLAQLSGNLAAHLIELFQHTPDAFFPLPLLAHGKLSAQFESVGRRLESLPPDIEVLANVIMAFSSRISSHPLILGPGLPAPAYEDLDGSSILVPTIDLREFGRRRESMCIQFRDQAVRMIWERGAMVNGGEPNAASNHLMDVLEVREGIASSRPYGSAFICHIRAMADDTNPVTGISSLSNSGIHWSPFLMQEALVAESHLRAPLFTRGDQLSISGPSPSIDLALHQNVQGLDLREVMKLFYLPMQAFTHGVTNLARDAAENLVGTVARRSPLNEPYLSTWLVNLDTLHSLLMLLQSRIGDQLSQTAVAAYALPHSAENERAFVLRACRFTLPIAHASLVLSVYREMERRMQIAKISSDEGSRRQTERLKLLFSQVKRVTIRGARTIARCLLDIPTMAYITHLHFLKLDQWANILAEMSTVEEGGDGITGPQRVADLNLLIAGLRRSTFCWSHHNEVVDSLDMAQQLENLLQGYGTTPSASNNLNGRSSFPFNSQPIPQPLQPIVNQSPIGQVPMIPSPHLQQSQLHQQQQQQQQFQQSHQLPQIQTQNFLNSPFSSLMNEDVYYSMSGSNSGVTPTGLVSTPEFSGGGGIWDNSGRGF